MRLGAPQDPQTEIAPVEVTAGVEVGRVHIDVPEPFDGRNHRRASLLLSAQPAGGRAAKAAAYFAWAAARRVGRCSDGSSCGSYPRSSCLATATRCTSSGPSYSREARAHRYICSSGMSQEYPSDPW